MAAEPLVRIEPIADDPLVGRAAELSYVLGALADTRGILLAGDPGVGKSRLARAVAAAVGAEGSPTVSLVAPSSDDVPFATFAPLLGGDAAGDGVDRFLRATEAVLRHGERPLVVVDEAHLLDGTSVAFLRHLLVATDARLLLTARAGAAAHAELTALWRSGAVRRVEVLPLPQDAVADLARAVLRGPVEPSLARWVWSTGAGNPLFVRELLLDALDRGVVVRRADRWTLDAPTRPPGTRLVEVVADRVGAVPDDQHDALELLAIGEPLGLRAFEDLAGPEVVQALERRRLVMTATEGNRTTVRLTHPVHGEVLRGGMGASTARALRRRLIDTLAATGARRALDSLRLAVWRSEVGDTSDWRPLLDASRELARAFDRPLATLWAGGKPKVEVLPHGHLEVALRLARAAYERGRSVEAAAQVFSLLMRLGRVDEARRLDQSLDVLVTTERQRLDVARLRADAAVWFGVDPGPAAALLTDLAGSSDDPGVRRMATATGALLLCLGRRPAETVDLGTVVVDDPEAEPEEFAVAAGAVAQGLAELGRTADALELLDRAGAGLGAGHDPAVLRLVMALRMVVLARAGRYDEAERLARLGYRVSSAAGSDEGLATFATARASLAVHRGEPRTAMARATEARACVGGVDLLGSRRDATASLVLAASLVGDLDAAQQAVESLDGDGGQHRWVADAELRARSWLDVARGHTSAALARLQAGIERAAADGRATWELQLLHDLVRLGHAALVVDRVAEIATGRCDAAVARPILLHARGSAHRDPGLLAEAAEGFAELRCRLSEAECWAEAARLLDGEGRRGAASTARARSRAAAEACEGAVTPALAVGGPAELLTGREREIAGLAARGLSDREIGEHLVVSKRTVQTHLYNAYAKLGVDGRGELGAALGLVEGSPRRA